MQKKDLTFYYDGIRGPISTSIYDAEYYQSNILLAPMIGTLVVYFSDERPTPYVAESWSQNELTWTFNIRPGLTCENGEPITAASFRESLLRSLKWLSQHSDQPLFEKLVGYEDFINSGNGDKLGLLAEGEQLIFKFREPFRSGFLEYLSMAPFGYICRENFNSDLSWKDKTKFVSSGGYVLGDYIPGVEYALNRREDYSLVDQNSPKHVIIKSGGAEKLSSQQKSTIVETTNSQKVEVDGFNVIKQIPMVLGVVCLSEQAGKWFESHKLRKAFSNVYKAHLRSAEFDTFTSHKTEFFFFNQETELSPLGLIGEDEDLPAPQEPLIIRSAPLPLSDRVQFGEDILKKTLDTLKWPYKIDNSAVASVEQMKDLSRYDIRLIGAEVGSGFEGWVVGMLFCSEMGANWPDPSGRVCQLVRDYEKSSMDIKDAIDRFNTYLHEDAALFPVYHRGGYYLVSDDIDISSLSPLITRIRFDEIRFKNND